MIGKLTIDKSSMNISYFLYSIKLVCDSGGRISRKEFTEKMSCFVGVPAEIDGKENRTSYNKSKMPRYFGFMDVVKSDKSNDLVITNRGLICNDYIQDNGSNYSSDIRYSIAPKYKTMFKDLILYSVIYDSFGKNNSGAEQSNTDIEPPKVVFKTIRELNSATAEEICYVMFGMNRGIHKTFEDAINTIKQNRTHGKTTYKLEFDNWNLSNIVNDCKIINIFSDNNIGLLSTEKNRDGVTVYSLGSYFTETRLKNLSAMSPVYKPLMLFAKGKDSDKQLDNWINYAILGKLSNESLVYKHSLDLNGSIRANELNTDYKPNTFENAVLAAYKFEKQNVYLLIECHSKEQFDNSLDDYCQLLTRVDDYVDKWHGWSINTLVSPKFSNYLIRQSSKAKSILEKDCVRLPSNLHLIIEIKE